MHVLHRTSQSRGVDHSWSLVSFVCCNVYNGNIVIDVSTKEEQESLRRHFQQAYRYDSSPFQMLRAFTRHPIHTAESLARLPGRTCFHSLHTGLDISK